MEPRVGVPANRSKFTLYDSIDFDWTSVGALRDLDWYRIQISPDFNFQVVACEIFTKETRVQLQQQAECNENWKFNARYFWHIDVIARDDAGCQ